MVDSGYVGLLSVTKITNDPIHGIIDLDRDQLRLMDTPQFQRLRDLKQLGSAYYVFPGASHNRFEHSLGVSYLADAQVTHLARLQPELDINARDIRCVKLAGLCHDLGHGPFSHVFDHEFIPRARPDRASWTHEQGSEMLLDYLVDDNGIDLSTNDLRFIKDLIQGEPRNGESKEKAFLFDIVANKRNGVDVDKFDYLLRDCYNVGLKSSYDCLRTIHFSRVIDNQLCYNHKEIFNIHELFHTRYSLFKRIYTHKVGKAVEYMIVDAMLLADPVLDISGCIDDGERYMNCTDSVLREIEKSTAEELKPARELIRRLRKRQLYKYVDQYALPDELEHVLTAESVTPERIRAFQEPGAGLKDHDIIVDWLPTHYGMKSENPLDMIKFYGKWKPNEAYTIPRDQLNYIAPERYQETVIRIFARDPDRVPQIQKAFRKFMQSLTRDVVRSLHASPVKLDVGSNGTEGGMTTSPLKATVETDVLAAMDHLHTLGLTGSTIAPRTTTIRGTSVVREYEPHPIDEVPDERAWIQLSAERGWSPMRRPSGRTSGNGTSSSTPLRGRKLDFDDDGDVVSGGAVGPKGNVLDVEDLE